MTSDKTVDGDRTPPPVTGDHLVLPATPVDLTGNSSLTLVGTYPITLPFPKTQYRLYASVTFSVDRHTPNLGTIELRFIAAGETEILLARNTHSGDPSSNDNAFTLTGGALSTIGALPTGEVRLYVNRVEFRAGDVLYFSHIAFPRSHLLIET